MKHCLDLSGRVGVVIGATSGLGRTLAVGLAQQGADVVPTGRRSELLPEICAEIGRIGRQTLQHAADVTDRASIDRFRDAVLEKFGRVDVLVNAAGKTFRKPTVDITEAEWSEIADINLNGTLRGCQAFYEPLKASGRGRIINIASLGSFLAFHEVAAYCAAKSAL